MKNSRKSNRWSLPVALVLAGSLGAWVTGCTSAKFGDPGTAPVDTSVPAAATQTAGDAGGARLWADSCGRCHNLRSPSSYSAEQWQVIGHHMRIRCYLCGEDERAIVEFLKAGAGDRRGGP